MLEPNSLRCRVSALSYLTASTNVYTLRHCLSYMRLLGKEDWNKSQV